MRLLAKRPGAVRRHQSFGGPGLPKRAKPPRKRRLTWVLPGGLALGLLSFALVDRALAANTGFLNPSAESPDTGGDNNGFELNPTHAFINNGNAFASNIDGPGDRHRYYNYGVNTVPAGSFINGIEVRLDWWSNVADGDNSMKVELSWDGGTSWTVAKTSISESKSDTNSKVLGNATDDWGHTWTASELSDAYFRVRVTSSCTGGPTTGTKKCSLRDFFLDWVAVKVHYTPVQPNPALAESCGVDMVLVIDSSSSINATELGQMKTAFKAFVGAFLPSTPTQIALVEFDNSAMVRHGFTGDAGDDDGPAADTDLYARIDQAAGGGYTNWDDALFDARSLFPNRSDHPDLIVLASDGNPNRRGGHTALGHSPTVAQAPENAAMGWAIEEANAAKLTGVRIVTLGIGGGSGELEALDVPNLVAISGPTVSPSAATIGVTTDVILADFGALADALANLALTMCGGTVDLYILEPSGDDSGSGADMGDELIFEATAENMLPGESETWTIRLRNDGTLPWDIDLEAVDLDGSTGAECDASHGGDEYSADFGSDADAGGGNHDGLVHVEPGMDEDVIVTVTLHEDAGNPCQGDVFFLVAEFTASQHGP